ncbi:cytosolic protein [Cytobacillus sp. OWB-43]|uniref:cytosolic protein n=1 Tax=Cytobacillus sp. OWB-43 TaxID=3108468 RepID=UPI002AFE50A4|nr:cytosolic protein [Cytobacillus sp. OWB-43]MEA1853035.1 cytosolic protein [Cytobacillus sp. OWB-43]
MANALTIKSKKYTAIRTLKYTANCIFTFILLKKTEKVKGFFSDANFNKGLYGSADNTWGKLGMESASAIITAYNYDIQKYMEGQRLSTKVKNSLLDQLKDMLNKAGESFYKLFPRNTKRTEVLDSIMYLLSGNGICKIESKTLANKVGCSVRTVYTAVRHLKESGLVLVAGLADGQNKYVFVLKSHPDFKKIMQEVFYIDDLSEIETGENVPAAVSSVDQNAEPIAEQVAGHIAELGNAETVGIQGVEGTNPSFNLISLNINKQENKIYIQNAIENELAETTDHQKELEQINTYYVNDLQHKLFNELKYGQYHQQLKDSASIIGLRVGSNCKRTHYITALQAVIKINKFLLADGTVRESIPAMFTRIYRDIKRVREVKKQKPRVREPEERTRTLPFYNWLDE